VFRWLGAGHWLKPWGLTVAARAGGVLSSTSASCVEHPWEDDAVACSGSQDGCDAGDCV
jgi:hypothetical protein